MEGNLGAAQTRSWEMLMNHVSIQSQPGCDTIGIDRHRYYYLGHLRAPNFLLCFVYPKFSQKAVARLLIWGLVGFRLAGMKSQSSLNHWGNSQLQAWLFTDLVM